MPPTEIRSKQIKDGQVWRSDVNITQSGEALIRRLIAGTNLSISSTGVDTGTGDVTVSVSSTPNFTTLSINGTQILDSSRNLSNIASVSVSGEMNGAGSLRASNGYQVHTITRGDGATNNYKWYLIGSFTNTNYKSGLFKLVGGIDLYRGAEMLALSFSFWLSTGKISHWRTRNASYNANRFIVTNDGTNYGVYCGVSRYGDVSLIVESFTGLSAKLNLTPTYYSGGSAIPSELSPYVIYDTSVNSPSSLLEIGEVAGFGNITQTGTNLNHVINSTSATTNSYLGFQRSGALKGVFGNSWASNNLINGSVQDDMCIRNSRDILFSCDSGTNLHARISTSGMMLGSGLTYGIGGVTGYSGTISFADKDGNLLEIEVVGGIITNYTVN